MHREHRFARVKVPESLPRFVRVRGKQSEQQDFVLLEDLIGQNLGELFPGLEIRGSHPFRVTRGMDLDVLERRPTAHGATRRKACSRW